MPGLSQILAIIFQEGNSQAEISSQFSKEILKHKYVGLISLDGGHKFVADEVSRKTNYCQSHALQPCLWTKHHLNVLTLCELSSRLSPPSGPCSVHGLVRDE